MKESKVKNVERFLIFLYFNSFFTFFHNFQYQDQGLWQLYIHLFTLTDHCEKQKQPHFDVMRILIRNHATTMRHERIFCPPTHEIKRDEGIIYFWHSNCVMIVSNVMSERQYIIFNMIHNNCAAFLALTT